jgi:hypothetical protein
MCSANNKKQRRCPRSCQHRRNSQHSHTRETHDPQQALNGAATANIDVAAPFSHRSHTQVLSRHMHTCDPQQQATVLTTSTEPQPLHRRRSQLRRFGTRISPARRTPMELSGWCHMVSHTIGYVCNSAIEHLWVTLSYNSALEHTHTHTHTHILYT